MSLRLTAEQLAYLRSQPANEPTKIPLALRIVGATRAQLAEELGMWAQQLSAILAGADIRLSTAFRIADAFGADVGDLFPKSPVTKATRKKASAPTAKATRLRKSRAKQSPKAEAA